MYIRRLYSTKGFIIRIEHYKEDIDFKREMKKPELHFQWKYEQQEFDRFEGSTRKVVRCVGEITNESTKIYRNEFD